MINRNLAILFTCQLIAAISSIVVVTLGGIIGSTLAATPTLATLPVSLMIVGGASATVPAAMLMRAIGRRLGFALAALVGSAAGLTAATALAIESFALFCGATFMFGVNLGFVQQYRFAAAESVPIHRVSHAISLVLLGSIGGALIGPELVSRGRTLLGGEYAATMLMVAALLFLAALLMLLLRNVVELDHAADAGGGRPLKAIVRQPLYIVALMGGVIGYSVMSFVMTATPVSMHVIDGHSVSETAAVIRSHVIAMYAPSLVSGFLIARLGTRRMMAMGALTMLATVVIGLQGHAVMHYWLALIALGIGWNFLYIGGTTLLTRTYRGSERFRSQAVNDLGIFGMSATGSLLAGTVIHLLGWTRLMLIVIAPLLAMLLALYLVRGRQPLVTAGGR